MNKKVIVIYFLLGIFASGIYLLLSANTTKTTQTTQTVPQEANINDDLSESEYLELDTLLAKIVEDEGPKASLSKLTDLMKIDPKVERSCHGLVHDIGHAAYAKYQDFSTAVGYQDDVCGSGYLHGVIEAYFKSQIDLLSAMKKVCNGTASSGGKCYHGVGHGIMYFNNNNLPEAISLCDTYPADFAKITCSEGVFMENFNSEERFHTSKYLNPADPLFPCRDQTNFYKYSCYFYAPDYFLRLHNRDYAAAVSWCRTAEEGYISKCLNGLGSRVMKQNIGSPLLVESICEKTGKQELTDSCIDGLVSYFLVNYESRAKARAVCATLHTANRPACFTAISKRSTSFAE